MAEKILNLLLYAGLSKEKNAEYKSFVLKNDVKNLGYYLILSGVLFFCLGMTSIASSGFAHINAFIYLSTAAVSFAILILQRITIALRGQSSRIHRVYIYLFMMTLYSEAIVITIMHNSQPAVTYIGVLLIMPLLFAQYPLPMIIFQGIFVGLFCVASSHFKLPDTAAIDIWNGISFLFVSIVEILLIVPIRFNQIIQPEIIRKLRENNAKTDFMFNISHDVRTPMNAILGYSRMLEKDAYDPGKVLDYQKKIQKSGELLLDLLDSILEMSRIDSGQVELHEKYYHTGSFLQEIADVYEADIREKNLTLICKENVQTEHIMLDVAKAHEIFSHLMGNAVKYTPAGGVISAITTELPSDREGYVLFRTVIEDNGIGISEDFLPCIFDAFSRERNTTLAKTAGAGLGLSIVKRIVDAMGGSISVKSKVGVGTTFTMLLYHKLADESCCITPEPVPSTTGGVDPEGKRILLAEDNDLNAEIAVSILEDLGFQVERAEDGLQCVHMLREAAPGYYDLILMDIQMPNLDGYGATEQIREAGLDIPIIAVTANAFEEDKKTALAAGMNGHLAKPINVAELMKALEDV